MDNKAAKDEADKQRRKEKREERRAKKAKKEEKRKRKAEKVRYLYSLMTHNLWLIIYDSKLNQPTKS